ncbi:hypothetical protein Tco_0876379 [Tanacetum coccineum]|uniref:Uncharacterized protein n=1 Tax=Tanacetum coccineum TaxID=301880 RepID=A0ABQ5BVK8_9ASTR
MSAYVHGNTSALHWMSYCSFLLKLVAKNICHSLQNAFLDLLLSLFYLVGFIGRKYNTNPMRSVEFHYCMDCGQYDPYLLHGCYSEEKIVWGIGPDDDKVQVPGIDWFRAYGLRENDSISEKPMIRPLVWREHVLVLLSSFVFVPREAFIELVETLFMIIGGSIGGNFLRFNPSITILTTNTMYPSRKIRRIRAYTHQRPQRDKAQYAVSRETQYAVFKVWSQCNILEDIKRGPYFKKSPICLAPTFPFSSLFLLHQSLATLSHLNISSPILLLHNRFFSHVRSTSRAFIKYINIESIFDKILCSMILRPCGRNYDYVIHNMPTTYKDFKGHQRVSCDVAPWYNGLGMAILAIVAPLAPGVKPLVTTNEQPSVEATHKDEAPVVILTRAFRGVDKATLAFGKAHCKVPWTNERPLENRELNAIIGAWFTLWRD